MFHYQNLEQNRNVKLVKESFENVEKFRYLWATVTNQNLINKKIKSRLNLGKACYHSLRNFLSFRLLAKHVKIKINKTIIWTAVLYGCETWPLTLREEYRLRVFENRVLMRIFWPKKNEILRGWRKLYNMELHKMYSSPNIRRIKRTVYEREEGYVQGFGGHIRRNETTRSTYTSVGRYITKSHWEIGWIGGDRIHLAQDS